MPTPFYHLNIAQDLIAHPQLANEVRDFLLAEHCVFNFGNIAPDVQSITSIPRVKTHFFDVPILPGSPPWKKIFKTYPDLHPKKFKDPAHQAFIAGYLCHLQADFMWIKRIFQPYFGLTAGWETFEFRLFMHNVLRTHLDTQILPTLQADLANCLADITPVNWLPFVSDEDLNTWRDAISRQLKPNAEIETIPIFAARQGITTEEFNTMVNDTAMIEKNIYARISQQELIEYRNDLIEANIALLHDTLQSILTTNTESN